MSYTNSDQVIEALVGIVTAMSSVITTAAGGSVTIANIGTACTNYGNNDSGITAQTKDLMLKLGTAFGATSPSSSIRNSVYGA